MSFPSPCRVLLVDDDAMLRLLGVEALEGAGFDVVEAENGEEALARFTEWRPDLVVLDVMMPGMDGFEVCARLKQLPSYVSTPILMVTGLDDGDSIDRAYESGATDFVTKPINYVLLSHRLRYLLRASNTFEAAKKNEARLARAQRLAHLAQWRFEPVTKTFRWSAESTEIYGFASEPGSMEEALLRWVHPEDRLAVARAMSVVEPHAIEYRVILADGRTRIVHQEAERVIDPMDGRPTLEGAAQDISELRSAERQVRDLAFYDSLTHLPNRAFLRRYLGQGIEGARAKGAQLAVLALDLDGFKQVNDTLGHTGGDELLREVATRIVAAIEGELDVCPLPSCTAEEELALQLECQRVIAARLGGDEFVVVLRETWTADEPESIAKRLGDRLATSYVIGGKEVFASCSIGIARFPLDGEDIDELLDRADVAMYHAKHNGRNCFKLYASSMEAEARARIDLEILLRAALAHSNIAIGKPVPRDGGEFRLVYQPKVEVPSGAVVGVEALLRWVSPARGFVSPVDFIPITETTGLIVPLGEWVLREACYQAKTWSDEGRPLRVAVNVSARQFREPGFVALVRGVLEETKLPPSFLELEITEGMVMENTASSKQLLEELKQLGVRISLDDFGTGYSSLSYLTRLPIDAIKIDRSFINDVGGPGRGETITAAIVALSRSLAIDVVVEGVETFEQLAFVNSLGPAEIQGYYFARPMAPEQVAPWRKHHEMRTFPPTPRAA